MKNSDPEYANYLLLAPKLPTAKDNLVLLPHTWNSLLAIGGHWDFEYGPFNITWSFYNDIWELSCDSGGHCRDWNLLGYFNYPRSNFAAMWVDPNLELDENLRICN